MKKSSVLLDTLRRHFKRPVATALAVFFPLWAAQVQGATLYYNVSGSGQWDTTSTNWSTDSSLTDAVTWDNASIAVFAGVPGTITLNGPITAGGLVFGSDGYVITGGTLTLSAVAGLSSSTINVASFERAEIDSVIAGSSGLTKTGNGTLLLGNQNNTFSGDVVINGGSLVITDQGQLGKGKTTISVNGLANGGNPGFSGGSLVVQGGTNGITVDRSISVVGRGPGAYNNGAGLISIGNNTFTGNIVVASTGSEGRMLAASGITTITGGLQLGTGGAEAFIGNGNYIISGIVTGYDTSTQDRFLKYYSSTIASTMWLQNLNNNFAQPLRIDGGTVRVTDNRNLGSSLSPRAVDLDGGWLEVHTDAPNFSTRNVYSRATNGYILADRALDGTGLNQTLQFGNLDADNATFNFYSRDGYNLAFNGSLGSGTTLQWSGGGNLTFNNNMSGTLTLDMNIAHDSETTQRVVSFNGNGDTVLTGAFLANGSSNALAVAKGGIGQMTLTDVALASTSIGATTINAGTLAFYSANALPTGQIQIGNASTTSAALTYLGAGETLSNAILLNTTTVNEYLNASGTGALIINGAITAVAGAKTLVLGGTNTDNNTIASALPSTATINLQKVGTGTWVLTGANLNTGSTTISNGLLKIQDTFSGSSRNVLANAGSIIFNVDVLTNTAGGTFQYLGDGANSSAETVGALVATAGAGTVQVTAGAGGTAALTFSSLGTISAGTGINFVTNAGAAVNITGAASTNGIINAHLFFNGADFANGSSVGAAAYTTVADGSSLAGGNTLPYLINTLGVASQATATINAGIKFNDSVDLTLASAATLALQNGTGTVAGGILVTGGSSVTLSGGAGITSGGTADLVFRTDTQTDTLTLGTSILSSSTGGWTKLGAGTLVIGATNANVNTAYVNIDEGTVRLAATGATLGANALNVNLFQGATLDLNGFNLGNASSGTGALNILNGAGTITNSAVGTTANIRIGDGGSGAFFSGVIEDGAGQVALVKSGSGTIVLSGANTFTGPVTLLGGNLDVSSLANIGQISGIGMGDATSAASNAASLVFNGGSLRYVGTNSGGVVQATQTPSVSIDRLFTLAGSGGIYSYGSYGNVAQGRAGNNAALIFSNTGPVAFSGTGARTLTLGGDSLGDNQINLKLIDNTVDSSALSLNVTGGLWILGNSSNTYSGPTVITGGYLRAVDGASLSTASNLRLAGGVFQTSGTFSRAIGTGAGQISWTDAAGTGTNKSGGFAASIAPLTINFGGAGDVVSWGAGGIGNGTGTLILSSNTSWADVTLVNPIDLNVTSGTVTRTIQVDDNGYTNLDYATVSGVISNSGAGTAILSKTGGGTLILGDSNTYNGNTTLTNGSTIVTSIGANGATSSSFGTNVSGGSLLLGSGGNTVNLLYVGAGETVTRPISLVPTTGTIQIDSSGSGPLILTNVVDAATNQFSFNIRGTNTDLNTISANLADSTAGAYALRVYKTDGGVWALTGANTYTGGTRIDSGLLGIGSSALGPVAVAGLTVSAATTTTTVTTSDTSQLKVGMYVNGIGLGYGDVITGITNSTTFTISNARTIAAGTQMIFGGLLVSNGEIFATDFGGLETTQPILWNNNSAFVVGGSNQITLDGNIYKLAGTSDQTLSNNLDNGAQLIVNGNYVNLQNAAATRNLNIRGYGSTLWNGVIQDYGGTSLTRLDIRISNDASFTLGGDNSVAGGMTGGVLLGQGTLVLGNVKALGSAANALILDGGVLTSVFDLTGTSKLMNAVTIAGDPAVINGTQSIEFGASLTNNGANRVLQNDLGGGAELTLSGGVNLTESSTNRTMYIEGSGTTNITGAIVNGSTSTASALAFQGYALNLSATNTFGGALSINRGTVTISGAGGSINTVSGVTLNAGGVLVLDNSGGNNANGRVAGRALTFNGGALSLIGNAAGTTETMGNSTVNNITGTISMSGSGSNTLSFGTVSFANSGSSWDLSGISGLGVTNKVKIANYQHGVATYTNAIMPRIIIADDFAAYDSTNGVVRFTAYNGSNNLDAAANGDTMNVTASANVSVSRTLNALKINGSGLSITSTGNRVLTLTTGSLISTGGDNTLAVSQVSLNGQSAYFQVQSGTTLHVTSTLMGTGQLSLVGGGTMSLESASFYNSTTNVMGGTLQLNAGLNAIFPAANGLNIGIGATVDLNGSTQYLGNLTGSGFMPNSAGTLTNTALGTSTFVTNGGGTFGGLISGAINLGRVGGGTLTLETAQTYTGTTSLLGGSTTLENDATLLNTTAIEINGATLTATSNTSLQTQNNDRIGDNITITLRGGTLAINGRVNTAATETLGDLISAQGANTLQAATGSTGTAGAFSSMDLTIASLTRSAGTTMNFLNSTALGGIGNWPRIVFTAAPTTYADGVLGAWAISNYSDYAAYNTTNGVGTVGNGGYAGYSASFGTGLITDIGTAAAAPLTTTLTGSTTTGMLRISGNFTNNLAFTSNTDVLNLELGGILRSNNVFDTSIGSHTTRGVITAGGTETSGTRELIVYLNATGNPAFGGGATTTGTNTVTMSSTIGLQPGMTITNAGLPAGTTIVSIDSINQVTLSNNATATATNQTFVAGAYLSGTTTQGSAQITMNSTVGIAPGMTLTGTGIPNGTYVVSVDSSSQVTLSQAATANGSGLTFTAGVSNMIINSVIADNGLGNMVSFVKSGSGVVNLSANNTYTGGTVVDQGTLNLIGTGVVLPAGGLTINNAAVTMLTNNGQIAASNDVTLVGSSSLTLAGGLGLNNTLSSITFNNNGGSGTPTITNQANSILTLTSSAPITVLNSNASTVATINGGYLALSSGNNTFSIQAPTLGGQVYSQIASALSISSVITGTGARIIKTDTGLLQLSGQSTFDGGMDVQGGGIILSGGSTSSVPNSLVAGPLGIGAVSFAAGTSLLVDNNSRTVANAMTFAGNPIFNNTWTNLPTLTLNGALTFATLNTTGLVINIPTPYLNVALGGPIANLGSVTSIGGATGANTITKLGTGNITAFNFTGINSTASIDIGALNNGTAFSLLTDGDGTESQVPLNFGDVTWNSATSGTVLTLTVGRAGTGVYYPTPAYQNIVLNSFSSSSLGYGLAVTANNGYGLALNNDIALNSSGAVLTVNNASASNVVQGLTLNGVLSGATTGFTKAGSGTLALTNAGNTFGGAGAIINITGGYLSVSNDGALGNAGNVIQISTNSTSQGFRATGNIDTSRTFNLNGANSTFEVSIGNTLTLESAFTFSAATNNIVKNDRGTLVLAANNTGWNGTVTVNQGVVGLTNSAALGGGTAVVGSLVGQIQLSNDITISNALNVAGINNQTFAGINASGALRSVSGGNTWSGSINLTTATTADNNNRALEITADSGSTLNLTGGLTAVMATAGTNRNMWFGFGGAGTINLNSQITFTGGAANDYLQIDKTGSGTLNITVANAFAGHQVFVNQGVMSLNGAGSLAAPGTGGATGSNTIFVTRGGLLELDNSTTNVNNRLGTSRNMDFRGGSLSIIGNSASTTTETLSGILTFNIGKSTFTLSANPSSQLNFTTAAVARSGGGTLLVQASNLGTAAGAGVATIQGTGNGYSFVGQTGATGTSNKSIIPWAIGDTSTSGLGIGFLTANSAAAGANSGTNALRLLTANEESIDAITTNGNVVLTTATPVVSGSTTINSLVLGAGGGGVTINPLIALTLDSGGIIALAGNSGISGGILTTTSNRELVIHALGDLEITSAIARTGGGLTKDGAGTLTLSSADYYTGTTYVNEGILKLNGGVNTIYYNNGLLLQGGALDLNGNSQVFNNIQNQTATAMNANLIPDAGGMIINSSTTEATLGVVTGNASFAGSITGNVALVKSQTAGAFQDWNIYTANTYTGATIINGGRLQLLGTATLSNTSSIEIDQATLLLSNNNTTSILDQNVVNRINPTASILLRGGILQPRQRFYEVAADNFGAVTIAQGTSALDIATGGSGVSSYDVTLASLTQQAGSHGTLHFFNVGAGLGSTSRVFITAAPTLTNNVIGGWAVFERDFATYTSATGVGGLTSQGYAGYSPNLINAGTATDNIRIATIGTTTLTADKNIYNLAMVVSGTTTLDLGGNTLTLGGGGLIASNATDNTAITLQNGSLTAGNGTDPADLYLHSLGYVNGNANTINRDVNVNATIVNNGAAAVTLVIDGDDGRGTGLGGLLGGEATILTASNTYSGGTFVNSGRVILNNTLANGTTTTAIGMGDLTITGGAGTNGNSSMERTSTVQLAGSSQISNTATVNMLGGSILDLNGFTQTLGGLNFNNTGGYSPTISFGATGVLNLNGNITASGGNLGAVSTIGGTVIVASEVNATNVITVGDTTGLYVGMTVSGPNISGTPTITAITSPTTFTISNNAVGTGITQLIFGQFQNGNLNLNGSTRTITVDPVIANGQSLAPLMPNLIITAPITGTGSEGIIKNGAGLLQLSGNSTFSGGISLQAGGIIIGANSTPVFGSPLNSGPLGTGLVSVASGAELLVDNNSRTVANDVTFAGNPIFDSTGASTVTLTLNGNITMQNGVVNVSIANPGLTVALLGNITNASSITELTKTGLGNLIFNTTGYTGDITFNGSGTLSLLVDGDGSSSQQTIALGNITFDPGIIPSIIIGRAGTTLPFNQAQNKILAPASLSSISDGLTLTNNNGYGLLLVDNTTINSGAVFNVANATASNVTQGLMLNGTLSGTNGLTKLGNGTLQLGGDNSATLTGTVTVNQGFVSVSADNQLGSSGNAVTINATTSTAGLRSTGTFATARTINLLNSTITNNIIEVSGGNKLTIAGTNALVNATGFVKADNGTLEITASQNFAGVVYINSGAVEVSAGGSLGTGAITVGQSTSANGSALQLNGGVTLGNAFFMGANNNQTVGGINFGGQLESVAGNNTYSGLITMTFDGAIGADAGATLNIIGGITTGSSSRQLWFTGAGDINISTTALTSSPGFYAIQKYGTGTLTIQVANTVTVTSSPGFSIQQGAVVFSGAGTFTGTNSTGFNINAGGTLTLDNSGTNISNRLGGRALSMLGGTFNYIGSDSATSSEALGALTLVTRAFDQFTITPGLGQQANITLASLSRGANSGGLITFSGSGLGSAAGANIGTITVTAAPTFLGQTATSGTNHGILPYALVQDTTAGTIGFATDSGAGTILRRLATGEYVTNTMTANANVVLTTTPAAVASNLTINSLDLNSGGGLTINPRVTLTLNSGGLIARAGNTGISGGVLTVTNTNDPIIWTLGDLTINSVIAGSTGLVKAGAGTLTLDQVNTYTGNTTISDGILKLNAGTNTLFANQYLIVNGGTLDLNGNGQFVFGLLTDPTLPGMGGTITSSSGQGTLVLNQDNRTFAGTITGNVVVDKANTGTLVLTNANDFTGPLYTVGGTTTLKDSGALTGLSNIYVRYGSFTIDNTGIQDMTDRVNDTATINLSNGVLSFLGRAQTNSTETVGVVHLLEGFNIINASIGGTGVNSATLILGGLVHDAPRSAVNFTGSSLGQLGSFSKILISGGVTLTNNIIGAWATTNGTEFATYDTNFGVGPLGTTGFAAYDLSIFPLLDQPTENIRLTANSVVTAGGVSVYTLNMVNNVNTTFASDTDILNLVGGGLLKSGNSANSMGATVDNGRLTSSLVSAISPGNNRNDLFVFNNQNTFTINSRIIDNPTSGLALRLLLSGPGTVSLTNSNNSYTGGTGLLNGTLNLNGGPGSVILPGGGVFLEGATLNMIGNAGQIDASNVITFNGSSIVNLVGDNTLAGLVFGNDGGTTPTMNTLYGTLTLTGGIVSQSSNVGSVAFVNGRIDFGTTSKTVDVDLTLVNGVNIAPLQSALNLSGIVGSSGGITKTGLGVLQFNGQDVFTGPVDVQAGTIQFGVTNGGSRFSDITLESGTTLNLNGVSTTIGSLSGSGTVTNTTANSSTLTVGYSGASTTFSGQIVRYSDATLNAVNLAKIGVGTLTFDSTGSTISTATTGSLTINRGAVKFTDNGTSSFFSTAVIVNEGGRLILDNTGTANVANRLAGGALTLNGGDFQFLGANGSASSELAGVLTFGPSASSINLVAGTSGTVTVKFASLTQNSSGTAVVSGTNLGTDTILLFTTGPSLSNGILARIAVGTDFATYNSTNGIIAYTGYVTPADINAAAGTATVKVDSSTTGLNLNLARTINALDIVADNVTLGSNGGLLPTLGWTISSGGILVNGNNATINMPVLALGAEGIFRINGSSLNVISSITGTAGITKTGAGSLTLSALESFTGTTALNLGTMILAGGNNTLLVTPGGVIPGVSDLQVNGGLLDLNGNNQAVRTLLDSNTLAFIAGEITNSSATAVTLTTAMNTNSTFGGKITGNLSFTRSGNNTLTIVDAQTYTGATISRGGTLMLQDTGSLATSSITLNFGALNWNNGNLNTLADLNPVRIAASTPVTMLGATFNLYGGGSTDSTVEFNSLTIAGGGNYINVQPLINQGATATITLDNLIRDPGNHSVVNFNGYMGASGASPSGSTLGGQGTSLGGNIILNQINGAAGPVSYVLLATTVANNATVTVPSTAGLVVGMAVNGANIPVGATIASIDSATTFTLNSGTGVIAGTNVAANVNSGLINNLIGGWATADGNTFATYLTGNGISVMGQTTSGAVAPNFDGTNISAATLATQNINDANTARTITGAHVANSLRSSGGTATTFTISTASSLSLGVGWITNGNVAYNLVGTDSTSTLTSPNSDLYIYVNQSTTSINANITGAMALVKSGGAVLTLNNSVAVGNNTYTGGTYVQGGTLNLSAAAANIVVIPTGGLTINNATVTMNTNAGQIDASTDLTINGGGVMNFVGTNTINSVTFNNAGGNGNPTLNTATKLILTSAAPISVTNDSYSYTPVISGTELSLADGATIFTTGLSPDDLLISAKISTAASTMAIVKTGDGSLVLSSTASAFANGFNLMQGSLIFAASSTPTSGTVTSGPIGTGTLSLADGVAILSDGTARTIANAVSVAAGFVFGTPDGASARANAGNSLTLSGTVTLASGTHTITVGGLLMKGTISGQLTGGSGLTKDGLGTLVLSNTTNNYGGSTIINGGILQLGAAGVIPDSSSVIIGASGFLDVNGQAETIASLSGSGVVSNSGAATTLTVGVDDTSTEFSGIISNGTNALGITKVGAGSLTFSGANTNTGATTVVTGSVIVGSNNALSQTGAVVVGNSTTATNSATLDVSSYSQTIGAFTASPNVSGGVANIIIGSSQTLTATGNVTLGSNTSATDVSTINFTGGGAFVVNNSGGTFQVGGATGATNQDSAIVDMSALSSFTANLGTTGVFNVGDKNGGATTAGTSTLTLAATNTITAGIFNIGEPATQNLTQTVKLGSGANIINANTINVGASTQRGIGSLVFNSGTGTLTVRAADGSSRATWNMVNGASGTGAGLSGSANLTGHSVDLLLGAMTMASRSSGNTGSGDASATFSYDTGTLDVTTLTMSSRSGTNTNGQMTSTVNIGGGTTTIGSLVMAVNSGASGTATGGTTATFNVSGGNVTIGSISMADGGGVALNKTTSTLNFTGGTVTLGGDITIANTGGPQNTTLTLNGAVLDMAGHSIGSSTTPIGSGSGALNLQSGTLKNVAEVNGGSGITKTTAGTLVMEGVNTYTGGTAINGGVLQVNSADALSSSGTISFGGGTLQYTANNTVDYSSRISTAPSQAVSVDTNGQNVTFAGNLTSSGGSLTKAGAGTLALTGTNTYDGGTTVNAGTLQVGDGATGSGSVIVNGVGTVLSGSGAIAGSTTIGSGSILAPGIGDTSTSNATMTFTAASNPLVVSDGGQIQLSITTATTQAGAAFFSSGQDALHYLQGSGSGDLTTWDATTGNHDFISVAGTLSLGTGPGTITVLSNGYSAQYGDVFNLMDWTTLSGNFNPATDFALPDLSTSSLVWDTSAFTTYGILVVVPEPSRMLLIMFGLLGMLYRRRRRGSAVFGS